MTNLRDHAVRSYLGGIADAQQKIEAELVRIEMFCNLITNALRLEIVKENEECQVPKFQ